VNLRTERFGSRIFWLKRSAGHFEERSGARGVLYRGYFGFAGRSQSEGLRSRA
jgi:hypothetical protein